MDELRDHQAAFFTYVTGGAEAYEGRTMPEAHAGPGIAAEDFAAVAEQRRATRAKFDAPEDHADEVMAAVADLDAVVVEA